MALTPTELRRMAEAANLLDAVLRAAGITLNGTQRAIALSTVEVCLDELRGEWIALLEEDE